MGGLSRYRALSGTLDQIISSAGNGFMLLAVARVASVEAFGVTAFLVAITSAGVGLARGALGTPLMLMSDEGWPAIRDEARAATAVAVLLAASIDVTVLGAAFMLGYPAVGIAFAAALPFVLVQDVLRYAAIADLRPYLALASDAIWTTGLASLLVATWFRRELLDETQIVASWGALAGVSAVVLMLALRIVPGSRGLKRFWRRAAGSRVRFGVDGALEQVNVTVVVLVTTLIIGPAAAAALRGASTVLAPLAVLMSALPIVVIPESVRAGASSERVWRRLRRIGTGASVAVIVVGAMVTLVPSVLGEMILGETWVSTKVLLPIIAVEYAAASWLFVVQCLLRFQGKSTELMAVRISYLCLSVVLCVSFAIVTKQAAGVAVGLASSAAIMAAFLLWFARNAAGDEVRRDVDSTRTQSLDREN